MLPTAPEFDDTVLQDQITNLEVQQLNTDTALAALETRKLGSDQLPSIATEFQVQTENIADGAVARSKIADLSVNTAKILNGSVNVNKLAVNSVVTSKIANGAVTLSKIANAASECLLGATADGSAYQELTLGTGLSIDGSTINADSIGGIFTQEFVSADITLASNDIITAAHGLGVVPKLARIYAKCIVSNNGYAVDDLVDISTNFYPGTAVNYGIMGPVLTQTHIKFNVWQGGTPLPIMSGAGASGFIASGAQWVFIVKAWA
jgi:hypothetical protein